MAHVAGGDEQQVGQDERNDPTAPADAERFEQ
jgi:hypothetical protein